MIRGSVSITLLTVIAVVGGSFVAAIATNQDQTPEERAIAAEMPRLNRLNAIAEEIHDPKANTAELMTEAARLCGFSIWSEERKPIAEPLAQPKLGFVITDSEVKWYSKLQKSGHSATLGSVIDALDVTYNGLGADGSCGTLVLKALKSSFRHKNASVRALTSFVMAVNRSNPIGEKARLWSPEMVLSPVESLFLMRVVSEEMAIPVRGWLRSKENEIQYASIDPLQGQGSMFGAFPGWIEDSTNAVLVEGFTRIVDFLERQVQGGINPISIFKKIAGWINTALALIKVIETYASLECEFKVETPGQPLIRTTNRIPNEKRIVASRWYFDVPVILDFLKDNRFLFTPGTLDVDAPHSGALAKVETEWELVKNTNSGANQVVQTHVDLSKVLTDKNGIARVEFEGYPQREDMNRNQVAPVEKVVKIHVTPQVKATTMNQDVVDALTGALGIIRGGLGWATPVIESLYRLKWVGTKGFELEVRDWVPGETRGTINITIHGFGSTPVPGGRSWESLHRVVQYRNVVMEDLGSPPPAPLNLDPSTSPLVRQQAQQMYDQMLAASKTRPFVAEGPGTSFLHINDASGNEGQAGSCGEPEDFDGSSTTKGTQSETFSAGDVLAGDILQIGFAITLDLNTRIAVIQVSGQIPAITKTRSNVSGTEITSERNITANLLDVAFKQEGLKILVTEVKDLGSKQVKFKGGLTRTFYFGPALRYTGRCTIDFELVRVPKKNP